MTQVLTKTQKYRQHWARMGATAKSSVKTPKSPGKKLKAQDLLVSPSIPSAPKPVGYGQLLHRVKLKLELILYWPECW